MLAQGLSTLRSLSPTAIPSIRPLIQKQNPRRGQARHRTHERAHVAVSIIVPARDEASNITPCIQSLVPQWIGDDVDECVEVIAVNDASIDGTGAQLDALAADADARLHVIHLQETPQGWAGKPYALHSGAQQARGRWLLFTDADTRWQPGAVAALVAFAEDYQIDLLTTFPRQILPTPLERVVAPELVATLFALTSPTAVNSSRRPDAALANGQCILLRRAVYEAIGGFARPEMRGVILDDAALALAVKRAGYRLQVSAGQELLTVRMYPSARAAWQGWLRNITASYRLHSPLASTLGLLGFTTFHLTPYALTLAGVLRWRRTRRLNEPLVIGCLALGVSLFSFGRAIRALRLPWVLLLAHPISVILEQALLMQGWWRFMRRKPIMWKQRAYSPKPANQFTETERLELPSRE
ncbi:MAG TPA: glycosyltransferase [Ktedonobacterales bacterium]